MKPTISLVIPVYNEEDLIEELCSRTVKALQGFTENFEIICVNDGSHDRTERNLINFRTQDSRIKILSLSRNFGHQAAVWAGLEHAEGDFIGIMDGDLQDPPELFQKFHEKIKEGADVVYAIRRNRKESWIKRSAYSLFYNIMSRSSEISMPLHSGDFCMITREVLDSMLQLKERNPYIRGIRTWIGYNHVPYEYDRDERAGGDVKFTFKKLLKLAYDGFFGFSSFPIRLMGSLGVIIILGCLLYTGYILVQLFMYKSVPQGFTTIILAIMFFGGVQLFSIRVIGEYVYRIFDESRHRPIYIVKRYHQ